MTNHQELLELPPRTNRPKITIIRGRQVSHLPQRRHRHHRRQRAVYQHPHPYYTSQSSSLESPRISGYKFSPQQSPLLEPPRISSYEFSPIQAIPRSPKRRSVEYEDVEGEDDMPVSWIDKQAYNDAENKKERTPGGKTLVKDLAGEEVGNSTTPRREMKPVTAPLKPQSGSLGVEPMKHLGTIFDERVVDSPLTSKFMPPAQRLEHSLKEIPQGVESQGSTWAASQNTQEWASTHPTCPLILVCYRTGINGCLREQIQTVLESRFGDKEVFQNAIIEDPSLINTDPQFFQALRDVYLGKMCGLWRRAFFLKTLRGFRLLSFTPTSRPTIVPLDDFVLQEILYAYQNPSKITTEHEWIDWVFRLRQQNLRHALEFVEGWNGTRIAVAGSIPLLFSTVLGIVWSLKGSGIQDGFAIAGFILTAGSLLLALLAIISGIESSGRSHA